MQGALLLAIGVVVLAVVISGSHLTMVKDAMRIPLLATGAVLVVAGLTQLALARRDAGHPVGRIGALLAVPFVAMVLVPVAPLSAWTAQRSQVTVAAPTDQNFEPLPPDDVVQLPVHQFVERATFDRQASLTGRKVKLTGFVTPLEGGGWGITRIRVQCCAADARPFTVRIVGAPGQAPAANAWVEVVGTWVPRPVWNGKGRPGWPTLTAATVTPLPAAGDPYE